MTPEARARQTIDVLLTAAGWRVCDVVSVNLPPPGVIAQEIVEDLQAALEQFKLIAGDLGEAADVA